MDQTRDSEISGSGLQNYINYMQLANKVHQKLRPIFEQLLQSLEKEGEGENVKKASVERLSNCFYRAITKFQQETMIGLNARQQQIDLELFGGVRNNNMAAMEMGNELNDLSSIRDQNQDIARQQVREQRVIFGREAESIIHNGNENSISVEAPRRLLGMANIRAQKQMMILIRNETDARRNN